MTSFPCELIDLAAEVATIRGASVKDQNFLEDLALVKHVFKTRSGLFSFSFGVEVGEAPVYNTAFIVISVCDFVCSCLPFDIFSICPVYWLKKNKSKA